MKKANNNLEILTQLSNGKKQIVLLLDVLNHFIRNFVASYGLLQDNAGNDVSALYNSITSLIAIVRNIKSNTAQLPIKIFASSEQGRSPVFKEIMKEYKQNRPKSTITSVEDMERSEAFKTNIKEFEDFLRYLYPVVQLFHILNIEGDFLLAYILHKIYNKDNLYIIISTDKDFYQLISDNVVILNPIQNIIISKENASEMLKLKTNLDVKYYHILKTLTGDKSDNIKGLTGNITAAKIINSVLPYLEGNTDFESFLNAIQQNIKQFNGKVYRNILEQQDYLRKSHKIMDLSEKNIYNLLTTANIVDIESIFENNEHNGSQEIQIAEINELYKKHNFDFDLLIRTKRAFSNANTIFGYEHIFKEQIDKMT